MAVEMIWDPYLQKDVDALEGVQKFAMKLITRKWDQGYTQLMQMVDLPSLQLDLSRDYKLLCEACKITPATSAICENKCILLFVCTEWCNCMEPPH